MAPKAEKEPAEKKPAAEKPAEEEKEMPAEESYEIYILELMKKVHPDISISSEAMAMMNSYINDLSERLVAEASCLVRDKNKPTITSEEIEASVRLVLPGELGEHAVSEGTKAVARFTSSFSNDAWCNENDL